MQTSVGGPLLWRRILIGIAVVAVIVATWWLAWHIPRTIAVFTIAAFIAFGVEPIVLHLQERRIPKPLAITIVFMVLLLLIIVGLVIIVPLTLEQLQGLATNFPSYLASAQTWSNDMAAQLEQHIPGLHIPQNSLTVSTIGGSKIGDVATGVFTSVGAVLVNTATGLFIAFSAIVLSFFFLLNDSQIAEGFAAMFPPERRETARKLAAEITRTFGSYISGQVIVSAITGAVVAILSALIGFKFSLILGIITAIAYAIPVIGMFIAQAIGLILCIPQGGFMILWVQVIMFGMARVSDNILVPKIMGESVGVSPIGVMFAVFAGGELFGLPGLVLGIPAAALIKLLWKYFAAPWLHAQVASRETPRPAEPPAVDVPPIIEAR